ncbi:MAG: hypothetical protein JSV25_13545 [Spirochaetota bacterium]|nr:MAG: hypothetical protein JSV25_13545 [Spirochaetota bacterium]
MKIRKLRIVLLAGIFLLFSTFAVSYAANIASVSPGTLNIHEFLVGDLGLTGVGGRDHQLFSVSFTSDATPALHKLFIQIETAEGDVLLTGESGSHAYNTEFSDKTYFNYNIVDQLGGKFEIKSAIPSRIQDAILNTGSVPQGNFVIRFQLKLDNGTPVGAERTMTVIVGPYFLISISPAEGELVNKQKLHFKWQTNLADLKLNIYDRATGGSPIASTNVIGSNYKWPSLVADAPLVKGKIYFWQITANKVTTHGRVRVSGSRNPFFFYEGAVPTAGGLLDQAAVKAALEELGVTGIGPLDLKWVVYDDSVLFVTDNITSILTCIASEDDFDVRWE